MARPTKHEHEKRDERCTYRMTIAEYEHVKAQADACNLSVAEYTRRRTLGHSVVPLSRPKFDPALVNEINRIGVNVNQLALAVHTDREFVKYWKDIGRELEQVLAKVVADGS